MIKISYKIKSSMAEIYLICTFHLTINLENYTSFFTGINDNDKYEKPPALSVFPFNMKSVNCTNSDRRMEIQSVELKKNLSFCEKQNMQSSLTKCIQMKVIASCNGKQMCEQLTSNGCDDCSRLPKVANISFNCKGNSILC